MSNDSIHSDEPVIAEEGISLHGAEEAFLKLWSTDEETPSDATGEENTNESDPETLESGDEVETTDTDDEGSEEDPGETNETDEPEEATDAAKVASDDALVEYTVDGQTHRVSVKELKRLAGQEASLTRKSQEIANYRQNLEEMHTKNAYVLNALQQKALQRLEPYKDVDLFKASRELDAEDFDALRSEIQAAQADVQFFETEMNNLVDRMRQQQLEDRKRDVPEALKVIRERIPEWNDELYSDLRTFAVAEGMAPKAVNELIDPSAISIIHKAMLYDRAQKALKSKVTKVATAPKKVLKSEGRGEAKPKPIAAMERLAKSGSVNDAAQLLLSRWQ